MEVRSGKFRPPDSSQKNNRAFPVSRVMASCMQTVAATASRRSIEQCNVLELGPPDLWRSLFVTMAPCAEEFCAAYWSWQCDGQGARRGPIRRLWEPTTTSTAFSVQTVNTQLLSFWVKFDRTALLEHGMPLLSFCAGRADHATIRLG